jgi:CRISPR/Cas system endoribonuclease Cas6 (RAMP superfamily)
MIEYKFTLTLKSDAEPATGAGGHIINSRVPRDSAGNPIIPSTHLKGLIREELLHLQTQFEELDGLADSVCGKADEDGVGDASTESCFRISDAIITQKTVTSFVSRTKIDFATGKAVDTSLRTTEKIPVNTEFKGTLNVNAEAASKQDLALRLALLSIGAVGGNRTRGGGKCVIAFDKQNELPGDLLTKLFNISLTQTTQKFNFDLSQNEIVTLRLIFEADSPVCCPEHPVHANVIKSGYAIPASAVQGLILNKLNQVNPDAATQLFNDENFRAYPLLPCSYKKKPEHKYAIPLRVSLTHKVAKLASEGDTLDGKNVADEAITPYDWENVDKANPLKATGGILLQTNDSIELWKANSIPHILTAHGVLNDKNTEDGRNLYQVDSIAPLVWSGIVRCPKYVIELLNNKNVSFGKKRSTHGSGKLFITEAENETLPWTIKEHENKIVLIVQSPILLTEEKSDKSADEEFKEFVTKEWKIAPEKCMGTNIGIQFGWNRHGKGKLTGKGKRVRASRCVLPGSVIIFNTKERDTIVSRIPLGLGTGRKQGFGAAAVHPGKATKMFSKTKYEPQRISSDENEIRMITEALNIYKKHKTNLPSPSQISAVRQALLSQNTKALDYLEHQIHRTETIYDTWKDCVNEFKALIRDYGELAAKGLKLICDLRIADINKSTDN